MAPKRMMRPAAAGPRGGAGAVARGRMRVRRGAAKAAPKAKAKARAKAKAAAAGGVGPRRKRPASKVEEKAVETLQQLTMDELGRLDTLVLKPGLYYHRDVLVCGKARGCRTEGGQVFLDLEMTGTQDEELLKVMSGKKNRAARVHVCGDHCSGELTGEDLIHGREFERVTGEMLPWMSNLKEVQEVRDELDENGELRRLADAYPGGVGEKRSPKRKDKKEKKSKRKERSESPKKKKKKESEDEDEREVGQRSRRDLFEGTGLDPSYRARRKMLKKARRLGTGKKKKKKKGSKSGDSQTDGSSSSSSTSPEDEGGLFEDERRLEQIWQRYPGCLSAKTVQEAKNKLVTAAGTAMAMDRKSLPPILTQYVRVAVLPGCSAVMGQEVLSLAMAMDLLLSGKAAQCADLIGQRLKALEALSKGSHWTVGRQHELVRIDHGGLAEDAEHRAAARQAREEDKLRGLVGRSYGNKGADNYGGGKSAKKGKEPKGNARGRYEDTGRGKGNDGKREDQKNSWQKRDKWGKRTGCPSGLKAFPKEAQEKRERKRKREG